LFTTTGMPASKDENTIVCDGKDGIKVQVGSPGETLDQAACRYSCIVAHEESHKADAEAGDPGVCKGMPEGTDIVYSRVRYILMFTMQRHCCYPILVARLYEDGSKSKGTRV
jgi:hypothetical protein